MAINACEIMLYGCVCRSCRAAKPAGEIRTLSYNETVTVCSGLVRGRAADAGLLGVFRPPSTLGRAAPTFGVEPTQPGGPGRPRRAAYLRFHQGFGH